MTRIFLLDDHQMVREGLRSVLTQAGHEVVGEADRVDGALEAIAAAAPEVLLLDMQLHGESGMAVLRALSQSGSTVKTVVLSMSSPLRQVQESLQLGALGFMRKGSPASELLAALQQVASGQRYLGEGVPPPPRDTLQQGAQESRFHLLSSREVEILRRVVRGQTSAVIATELFLSPKTVETYRSRAMTKLNIVDLPALVRFAIQHGLLDLWD